MFPEIYKKYLKQINIWLLIFAILFSLMIVVSRHVFNLGTDLSTVESVYVTDFHFMDLIVWIGMVPVIYILLTVIRFFCVAGKGVFWGNERTSGRGILVLVSSFALIMLLWFPYFPSYWPGGT